MGKQQDEGVSAEADHATRASTKPASGLGHSAGIADAEDHKCFTVSPTAYLRQLSKEDRANAIAIHYQRPPRKTEAGTSYSLNFPILIVSGWLSDPEDVAAKVTAILNEHWKDEA